MRRGLTETAGVDQDRFLVVLGDLRLVGTIGALPRVEQVGNYGSHAIKECDVQNGTLESEDGTTRRDHDWLGEPVLAHWWKIKCDRDDRTQTRANPKTRTFGRL